MSTAPASKTRPGSTSVVSQADAPSSASQLPRAPARVPREQPRAGRRRLFEKPSEQDRRRGQIHAIAHADGLGTMRLCAHEYPAALRFDRPSDPQFQPTVAIDRRMQSDDLRSQSIGATVQHQTECPLFAMLAKQDHALVEVRVGQLRH